MARLTYQQKLGALAYRFYQSGEWVPKAGDFYTTSRADLEIYQVVSVEDGVVRTRYTEGSDAFSEWPEAGFLTEGFGPKRVFVPPWVLYAPEAPAPQVDVDKIAELTAEKNLYMGKYRALLKLVSKTRNKLVHVTDHIEDEGDRRYFGSTNDADDLKSLCDEMMSWIWDATDKTNRMKSDPYAEIRKQRARAEKAEAALLALTASPNQAPAPQVAPLLEKAIEALRPLSDAVFNDNGEMSVSRPLPSYDECVKAYFVVKQIRIALETPPAPHVKESNNADR